MEIILQVKKNCIIDSFRCFAFNERIKTNTCITLKKAALHENHTKKCYNKMKLFTHAGEKETVLSENVGI